MKNIILAIDGMTCSACSNGLEKFLNKQDGIVSACVNLVLANANVVYDENLLDVEKIENYIQKAGFASLGEFRSFEIKKHSKSDKTVFILFTILALLSMLTSMGGMFYELDSGYAEMFMAVCFLGYGKDILKNGWKNLIHHTPNMDTLVSIGVITSFLYSLFNLCKGNTENLYFESSIIILYFVKLGRYIDRVNKEKTKAALQKLVTITPALAILKRNNIEQKVTIDEIHPGDIVIARPGDKVAVDGEIVAGSAHFDESFISGESIPAARVIGDKIMAGSLNYDGYVEYRAEKIGKESTVSEIVKMVAKVTSSKSPIARVADIISGYFVPTVMIIAVCALVANMFLGKAFNVAIMSFVCVLVVACPCALGLATPLAIVAAEGLCLKKGILVKNSEVFEIAPKVNVVAFDKTGTLTHGRLKIAKVIKLANDDDNYIMQLAGSLESMSNHPISRAFVEYMSLNGLVKQKVTNFENIDGMGIKGNVQGKTVALGNANLLKKMAITPKHDSEKVLSAEQNSIVYVVIDGEIKALIGIRDILRESAKTVIADLKNQNIKTVMMTGDNEQVAKSVANKIKIDEVIANILPSEKLRLIQKYKQKGNVVMMCGDGINDSPALVESNIGVSINGGTEIALDAAGVILKSENLNNIAYLIKTGRRTVKIIKQNLFWTMFYNTMMIPIAAGALQSWGIAINPMMASLAMVLSSTTVVLNTLRLRK